MGTSDSPSSAQKEATSSKETQNSDPTDIQELQEFTKHEWQKKRIKGTQWWQRLDPGKGRKRAPWRNQLGKFLESTPLHAGILTLLLVDLLATSLDILTTMRNKSHDLNNCTALLESCQCVSHFEESKSMEFLHWIGIVILGLLLFNVGGLLLAFGVSFFRHPGYVLDLLVLTTALCLEILLDADTAGLLVILTLWRIVRVAQGIFEVTDEAMEQEIHKLEGQSKALEAENRQMQSLLNEKDRKIAQLEQPQNKSKALGDW
eukprot:Gb_08709 [translate_table: standard]